jgi:large subunit ribosomal protein L25
MIQLDRHSFEMMLRHHTSENLLFDVEIDKETPRKVLTKEIQRDPVTGTVINADFVEVSLTKKMRVKIPLMLMGEPVGVSQEGGVLEQMLRALEVECLPSDMVESIDVDVTALKLKETLLVEKLPVNPKLTVLTDKKLAVAGVMEPRAEEEVTPEAAVPGAEGAEPEVIGKDKKEGEEEGEAGEGEEEGEAKADGKGKADGKTKPEGKGKAEGKGKEEPAKKEEPKKKDAAGKKPEGKAGK